MGEIDYQESLRDANKALGLAAWSYVGVLFPLLGWILGGYALSLAATLPRGDGVIGDKVRRAHYNAQGGVFLSILTAVVWLVLVINHR